VWNSFNVLATYYASKEGYQLDVGTAKEYDTRSDFVLYRSVDLEVLIIYLTQPPKILGNLIMNSNRFAVKGAETVTTVFLTISLKL